MTFVTHRRLDGRKIGGKVDKWVSSLASKLVTGW